MIAGGTATGYAVYPEIIETTGIGLETLNSAIGVMFLFLGWGCLFWSDEPSAPRSALWCFV
jgi:hypothetical protein